MTFKEKERSATVGNEFPDSKLQDQYANLCLN